MNYGANVAEHVVIQTSVRTLFLLYFKYVITSASKWTFDLNLNKKSISKGPGQVRSHFLTALEHPPSLLPNGSYTLTKKVDPTNHWVISDKYKPLSLG